MYIQTYAYTFVVDGIQYYESYFLKTVQVESCDTSFINVTIPSEVEYGGKTYTVDGIGFDAFKDCSALTSITIPSTVTSIGGYAFKDCRSLTTVIFEDGERSLNTDYMGTQSLAYGLFSYCPLQNVYLGRNLEFEFSPFFNNKQLKKATIGNCVTKIGARTFCGCSALFSITIPNSVTSIEDYAFYRCNSLTTVIIENGDKWLSNGECVFKDCSIEDVYLGRNLYSPLFNQNSGLKRITITDAVTVIGRSAFSGCNSLTSITIPNTVTMIGSSAFKGCSSLPSITIPNGVTAIGHSTFEGCSALTSITMPNRVTTIEDSSFKGCSSLTTITLPDSVTTIDDNAFYGCSSLASITIPSGVTTIGDGTFSNCNSLLTVIFEDGEEELKTSEKTFNLSNAITHIYLGRDVVVENCLFDCPLLESFDIGNTVTRLDNILNGSKLDSLNIPSNVTYLNCNFALCHFDSFTFNNADEDISTGCRGVYIPSEGWVGNNKPLPLLWMASIDTLNICRNIKFHRITPFNGSFKLVKISEGVDYLDYCAFQLCEIDSLHIDFATEALKADSYSLSAKRISSLYLNRDLDRYNISGKIQRITLGDSIINIPNRAFYNCEQINYLSIGRNIKEIGDEVFKFKAYSDTNVVISHVPIPPHISSNTFRSYNATLLVPNGSLELYKNASYWNRFYSIKEMDENISGIPLIPREENQNDSDKIVVYDLTGLLMPIQYRSQLRTLPHGIYIVNGKKRVL